jgi:hypothetical protein
MHHVMKMDGEWRYIHALLTSAQMELSGQLHALAGLPPGKDSPITIGYEAAWAPEPVCRCCGEEKNLLCLQGIEPKFLSRSARNPVAIPMKLSRLTLLS